MEGYIIKQSILLLIIVAFFFVFINQVSAEKNIAFDWHNLYKKSQNILFYNSEDVLANFHLIISLANLGQIEEAYNHIQHIKENISMNELKKIITPKMVLLEEDKDNILLLNYGAFATLLDGDYLEAVSYFKLLTRIEPQNIWIKNYLASSLIELKEYDKAKKVLKENIQIENNKFSHLLLGIIYYRTGNFLKAVIEFSRSGDLLNKILFN